MPYSVVVADDHPVYLDALSRAVDQSAELALAGTANDGAEAVELIVSVRPDVAVLDVEMPVHSGPSVAAKLAQLELPTRVLFLSAHRDGATVYDALATGGYGYVTKDASMREIQEAVLRVASGVRSPGSRRRAPDHRGDPGPGRAPDARPHRARGSVLELAVKGLTVVAMGKELHLSPATVKVHLSTLYAKLGVGDRASAVAEAIRRGLVA